MTGDTYYDSTKNDYNIKKFLNDYLIDPFSDRDKGDLALSAMAGYAVPIGSGEYKGMIYLP
jgi:hypothetical protein